MNSDSCGFPFEKELGGGGNGGFQAGLEAVDAGQVLHVMSV